MPSSRVYAEIGAASNETDVESNEGSKTVKDICNDPARVVRAGTPLFPFSPPRLKSLPLPNTIPERTKTHFLKCLELAQSFNSKKNTDLWGYTYTALTKLDCLKAGRCGKFDNRQPTTSSSPTYYRSTTLIPDTTVPKLVDMLMTVPSSPLITSTRSKNISRNILKRTLDNGDNEICQVEQLTLSPDTVIEIVTRTFYKKIENMDVVFSCEETPSKPEEGAVNYNAFCILTDIPGEGVVLDYWFVFSYEQTWYTTTGSKMLDFYVLNDNSSDNKSHTEEEGPEQQASKQQQQQQRQLLLYNPTFARYLNIKIGMPLNAFHIILASKYSREASSADGANIGYRFFQNYSDRTRHLNLSQTVKRQLVNGFIKDYKTLLEVAGNSEWLATFLITLMDSRNQSLADEVIAFCRFNDGKDSGANLAKDFMKMWLLMTKVELYPENAKTRAVSEWREANEEELGEKNEWFWSFLVALLERISDEYIPFNFKAKVVLSAVLSYLNMASDFVMLLVFYNQGHLSYFGATIASLISNMLVQCLIVHLSRRHKGCKELCREFVYIFTVTKPFVDVSRTLQPPASDPTREAPAFSHYEELMFGKCSEVTIQSVPCAILQASAFVHFNDGQTLGDIAGQYDFAALSVAVSCVTIGFLVSTLSFDKDVDAKSRRTMGEFYGMIPDGTAWRFVSFVAMVMMSSAQFLSRIYAQVLLDSSNDRGPKWGWNDKLSDYVLLLEVLIFLIIKALRRDIVHWIKVPYKLPFGIFMRSATYIMGAFTGFMKLRHPLDTGGLAFAVSTVWSFVLSFIACYSYSGTEEQMKPIRMICIGSFAVWLVAAVVFFSVIKRSYIKTFFSVAVASDFMAFNFLNAKNEETKSEIFYYEVSIWRHIETEVKLWLIEYWLIWRQNPPSWMEDGWRALIPANLVPEQQLYGPIHWGGEDEEDSDSDAFVLSSAGSTSSASGSDALRLGLEKRLQLGEESKKQRILQRLRLNEKNRSSGEDHRDEMLAAVESLTEKDEEEEQEKKVDKAPLAKVRKEGEKHWDESFWT